MNVSVGVLYGCQRLVRLVGHGPLALHEYRASFERAYHVASAAEVLDLAQRCFWLRANDEGNLYLTDRGLQLVEIAESDLALRAQMHDYVEIAQPPWAKKVPGGRSEAVKVLPAEITQCFDEAGLLGDWDDGLVAWWDKVAQTVRLHRGEENLKVGREAERLSLEYEKQRTGCDPIWQSLESNYSGFDILSIVDERSADPLRIEVKGTYQPLANAIFSISRNEWITADTTKSYTFHLWLLRQNPKRLINVDYQVLSPHIPGDRGEGEWEIARVPFRAFAT